MHSTKKENVKTITIILVVAITSLLAVAVGAGLIFSQRIGADEQEIIITQPPIVDNKQDDDNQKEVSDEKDESISEKDITDEKTSAYHITDEDCDNECEGFENGTAGWRYCATICGIISPRTDEQNCQTKNDLSRDYCLRSQAINEKDPALCNQISDKGIATQCENQLIESIVDGF